MATPSNPTKHDISKLKPGSNPDDAKAISGTGDFGVHEKDVAERSYASENTKASDPGSAQVNSYEHRRTRQSGAGGKDNGPGSASGGDVDESFVGIGGSSLASNITKGEQGGAAETDGSSRNAGAGGPALGENQTHVGEVGGPKPQLKTVFRADDRTIGTSADEVDNAGDTIDDSFRGEISSGEASGRDDAGR